MPQLSGLHKYINNQAFITAFRDFIILAEEGGTRNNQPYFDSTNLANVNRWVSTITIGGCPRSPRSPHDHHDHRHVLDGGAGAYHVVKGYGDLILRQAA